MKRGNLKYKHVINWNIITLLATIGVVILGIILNYNKREIDVYKAELAKAEKEKNELKAETNPEWHIKFNNQREYYESQLNIRQSELESIKNQRDSIKRYTSKAKIGNSGDIGLSIKTARKVLAKIEDGRRDSGLLALNLELLNLYIQKDSYQNYLIKNQETVILNLKAVNAHTDRIIELYKGNISEYEERS